MTQGRRPAQPANQGWDVDPADIDRYLSGRPSRQEEAQPQPRTRAPRSSSGTADQLNQLQRAREGAARQGEPTREAPARRPSRPAAPGRQQFAETTPQADDLYDEGYDDGTLEQEAYAYDAYEADEDEFEPAPPARPRRQQSPARTSTRQRQRQPVEPVYEDDYDDELYNDDPFLTYADDEWDAPAPRRAPRQKPQLKVNRPNLPKFSMPASISQSGVVSDIPSLAMIGTMLLSAAIMAIVVSNRLDLLPGVIPTHISASGVQENLRGRNALWSVPLLAFALSLMNLAAAWFISRIDMFASRFLLGAMLLVQFVAWIAVIEYLW